MKIAMIKVNGVWTLTKYGITFTPDLLRFSELPNGDQCINMYATFERCANVFIGWVSMFENEEIWIRHTC